MGDSKRNKLFTVFILKNFPKAETILVVADGKGLLARELVKNSKTVIVFEPKFRGKRHHKIKYIKKWFNSVSVVDEDVDLIVGMHPDEATSEIIKWAKKNNTPFAVVPCCIVGKYSKGLDNYKSWVNRLKNIVPKSQLQLLEMKGKNLIVFNR